MLIPVLSAAIREQLDSLEHLILAGCTHEPVVALSKRLVEITPSGAKSCFNAENGSGGGGSGAKNEFS
ncbi:hypothetical protein BGS_0267 [Beggiatoa sp. SS]|nr:hypothetical protein BGS_0267 [Beggiatoa sp. SS]